MIPAKVKAAVRRLRKVQTPVAERGRTTTRPADRRAKQRKRNAMAKASRRANRRSR